MKIDIQSKIMRHAEKQKKYDFLCREKLINLTDINKQKLWE